MRETLDHAGAGAGVPESDHSEPHLVEPIRELEPLMAKIMAQDRAEPGRQTRNEVRHWTTSDLRSRGWSNGLIEKLLGEPDRTIPNRYRKSSRISAYLVERTLQAEQDPVFLAAVGKTQARRETARRAATTRLRNAIQWAASTKILLQCPTRSLDELQQVAVVTRNAFLFRVSRNHEELELLPDPRELDRPTLDHLCANLLRHECSDYDETLMETFGKTGRDPAMNIIRLRLNREIALQWPALQEECGRKIQETGLVEPRTPDNRQQAELPLPD